MSLTKPTAPKSECPAHVAGSERRYMRLHVRATEPRPDKHEVRGVSAEGASRSRQPIRSTAAWVSCRTANSRMQISQMGLPRTWVNCQLAFCLQVLTWNVIYKQSHLQKLSFPPRSL